MVVMVALAVLVEQEGSVMMPLQILAVLVVVPMVLPVAAVVRALIRGIQTVVGQVVLESAVF